MPSCRKCDAYVKDKDEYCHSCGKYQGLDRLNERSDRRNRESEEKEQRRGVTSSSMCYRCDKTVEKCTCPWQPPPDPPSTES